MENQKIKIDFIKCNRIITSSVYAGTSERLQKIVLNRAERHCKNGVILKVTNLTNQKYFTLE